MDKNNGGIITAVPAEMLYTHFGGKAFGFRQKSRESFDLSGSALA
jgi:hypothetical protein